MKRYLLLCIAFASLVSCNFVRNGEYELNVLTTNDVHGRYFDSLYVSDKLRESLINVSSYVDSVRRVEENVILIDAGDCLQGDNASFYFNFVDTLTPHLFGRMVDYIGYDAVVVGNHDIEAGHPVYDRIRKTMKTPFLAANALHEGTDKPYFDEYVIVRKGGLKVAIVGFTNPNIKNWLSRTLWEGMEFSSLIPFVQETVDRVRKEEKPDVVIVAAHTGAGDGDGGQFENQGLDLYKSLSGVDFVICAHDHRPLVMSNDSICLINAGSHCRNLGQGTLKMKFEKGKLVEKSFEAKLVKIDRKVADAEMKAEFHPDYLKVKEFTNQIVGELEMPLYTRDAYAGMSDYLNLLHTLCLGCSPAQISFAAPLTFNGYVKEGTLKYNDLFTIYPFENQLYVIKMTGQQVKDCLEYSYDKWINTCKSADGHILKISDRPDPRTGQKRWSFENRSYNFDSAAGLIYDVDITKPYGQKIVIKSMADGSDFSLTDEYNVAVTSYRASGGGGILSEGAGIDTGKIDELVVEYYPEIREILYDYLKKNHTISKESISDPEVIGGWKFVPERLAVPMMERDMKLLFPKR